MVLQSVQGYPQLLIVALCDVSLFHKTAEWLRQNIGITYDNKEEQTGRLIWHFQFAGRLLALRYDQEIGIRICPAALNQATEEDIAAFKMLTETLQFK